MSEGYSISTLSSTERERLESVYQDLLKLAEAEVPSVRAAARAALAHIAQALNGQGILFELYTENLSP